MKILCISRWSLFIGTLFFSGTAVFPGPLPDILKEPELSAEQKAYEAEKKTILEHIQSIHNRGSNLDTLSALAEHLLFQNSEVVFQARKTIREYSEWRDATLKMAESTQPRTRYLSIEILLMDPQDPEFGNAYAKLLTDRVPIVRRKAVHFAKHWTQNPSNKEIHDQLFMATKKEPNRVLKSDMLSSLGSMANEKSIKTLISSLKDDHEDIRRAAIRGLGNAVETSSPISRRALEQLREIASNPDAEERIVAFQYLGKGDDSPGRKLLRKIASDEKEEASARENAKKLSEKLPEDSFWSF